MAGYLVDVFLNFATGTFKSGYHIEFVMDSYEGAQQLSEILAMLEMFPKLMGRRGKFVVYLKSGECACSLLLNMGAHQSLMKLHNIIAERDLMNKNNRRINCEVANISKQVNAATEQVQRIKRMDINKLSSKLQETARARLNNPNASYEELAQILGITKSGVVNRLRKMLQK